MRFVKPLAAAALILAAAVPRLEAQRAAAQLVTLINTQWALFP